MQVNPRDLKLKGWLKLSFQFLQKKGSFGGAGEGNQVRECSKKSADSKFCFAYLRHLCILVRLSRDGKRVAIRRRDFFYKRKFPLGVFMVSVVSQNHQL